MEYNILIIFKFYAHFSSDMTYNIHQIAFDTVIDVAESNETNSIQRGHIKGSSIPFISIHTPTFAV